MVMATTSYNLLGGWENGKCGVVIGVTSGACFMYTSVSCAILFSMRELVGFRDSVLKTD